LQYRQNAQKTFQKYIDFAKLTQQIKRGTIEEQKSFYSFQIFIIRRKHHEQETLISLPRGRDAGAGYSRSHPAHLRG
jgi:hypothetical protein